MLKGMVRGIKKEDILPVMRNFNAKVEADKNNRSEVIGKYYVCKFL